MMVMDEKSAFGKGLTYNLGLFLAHQERFFEFQRKAKDEHDDFYYSEWFNGAGDHLFELEFPDSFPVGLKIRLEDFKRKAISFRNAYDNTVTEENVKWALREAKDLLMEIDKLLGVIVEKGEYE